MRVRLMTWNVGGVVLSWHKLAQAGGKDVEPPSTTFSGSFVGVAVSTTVVAVPWGFRRKFYVSVERWCVPGYIVVDLRA